MQEGLVEWGWRGGGSVFLVIKITKVKFRKYLVNFKWNCDFFGINKRSCCLIWLEIERMDK